MHSGYLKTFFSACSCLSPEFLFHSFSMKWEIQFALQDPAHTLLPLRHLLTLFLALNKITSSILSVPITQKGWPHHLRPSYMSSLLFNLQSLFIHFFPIGQKAEVHIPFQKVLGCEVRHRAQNHVSSTPAPMRVFCHHSMDTLFCSQMYEYSH